MPEDAPPFFASAVREARAAGQPVVLDFWAIWCAPCVRLERETFADPIVAKALERVRLIEVDLDKYPALGKTYGVSSIPDVLLFDRQGRIVDRLRGFEAAEAFRKRLEKLIASPADGG